MEELRPTLTREVIAAEALRIIDETGLASCTMRAVAAGLGVEAMSLYWHFPSKDALLAGIAGLIAGGAVPDGAEGSDWAEGLETWAGALRASLLEHPNAVLLLATHHRSAREAASGGAAGVLGRMVLAGFDRGYAVRALRAVGRFVVGATLFEVTKGDALDLNGDGAPGGLAAFADAVAQDVPGEVFRVGLRAMIDGLATGFTRT